MVTFKAVITKLTLNQKDETSYVSPFLFVLVVLGVLVVHGLKISKILSESKFEA